jgi:hypothetical protein
VENTGKSFARASAGLADVVLRLASCRLDGVESGYTFAKSRHSLKPTLIVLLAGTGSGTYPIGAALGSREIMVTWTDVAESGSRFSQGAVSSDYRDCMDEDPELQFELT